MANQAIGDLMETAIGKLREVVDGNTVVGTPVTSPDGTTVIPVSRLSFGFGSGGNDKNAGGKGIWGGAGAAVKMDPVGFLVIKDGGVRMLNIAPPPLTTVDRVLDMVPEVMDKVEGYVDKYTARKSLKASEE